MSHAHESESFPSPGSVVLAHRGGHELVAICLGSSRHGGRALDVYVLDRDRQSAEFVLDVAHETECALDAPGWRLPTEGPILARRRGEAARAAAEAEEAAARRRDQVVIDDFARREREHHEAIEASLARKRAEAQWRADRGW